MTSQEAWEALLDGNRRYAADEAIHGNGNYDRRAEIAGAQNPVAMILGCADSRVPPEVVFDQRLGDLFTVRVAGNVGDANAMGSFEYALLNFGCPLLVVLGHENCGAVAATIESIEKGMAAPGYIASIVGDIKPAVAPIVGKSGGVEAAVKANVKAVVLSLRAKSSILKEHVEDGKLRIIGAYYDLHDGRVTHVD